MFTTVPFLVVSVSPMKSLGRLLLSCLKVGCDSGEDGIKTGTCVVGSSKREAACVSSCEWAHVCVVRQAESELSLL